MPDSAYPHLFSPLPIGTLTTRNRLLMPAMSINFGVDDHGYVTDQLTAYFKARAAGGVGMMLVGGGGGSSQRTGTSGFAGPMGRRLHPGPGRHGQSDAPL